MSCRYFLLTFPPQECLLMTFLTSLGLIGSSVYNAAASVIRYLYVRSSLQQEINEVYKRSQFVYLSLVVTGLLCLTHVTDFYVYQSARSGEERSPLMLFRACLDPHSRYSLPLYNLLPVHHGLTYLDIFSFTPSLYCSVLLMFYYFCVIYSNFFLYKYLQTMTENNKAIKETDKKKNRKRNFIPAQASIMCAVVMVISYVVFAVLYSVPVSRDLFYLLRKIILRISWTPQAELSCSRPTPTACPASSGPSSSSREPLQ